MAKVVAFDFPLSLMYFHINNDRCIILIKLRRCLFEKIHRFQFIIFSLLSEIYWNIIKLKITGHVWNFRNSQLSPIVSTRLEFIIEGKTVRKRRAEARRER